MYSDPDSDSVEVTLPKDEPVTVDKGEGDGGLGKLDDKGDLDKKEDGDGDGKDGGLGVIGDGNKDGNNNGNDNPTPVEKYNPFGDIEAKLNKKRKVVEEPRKVDPAV